MRQLAQIDARLDSHEYPATSEELIAEYGDTELELQNGTETLGDALGRICETTFEDSEDACLAVYSALSKDAIGRANYSDRDAPSIGESGPEPVSF